MVKLLYTEYAMQKDKIKNKLIDNTEPIIEHLLKLYLMPEHSATNHWKQEIANFINKVGNLKGTNKFPKFKQIYDWTYGSYQDVITIPNYLDKMIQTIIYDYDLEISYDIRDVVKDFNKICETYFTWLAKELSSCGVVSKTDIYRELYSLYAPYIYKRRF